MFRKLELMDDARIEQEAHAQGYESAAYWCDDYTTEQQHNAYASTHELVTAKELAAIMMRATTFDITLKDVWTIVHTPSYGYEEMVLALLCTTIDDQHIAYISEHLYQKMGGIDPDDPQHLEWTVVIGMPGSDHHPPEGQ